MLLLGLPPLLAKILAFQPLSLGRFGTAPLLGQHFSEMQENRIMKHLLIVSRSKHHVRGAVPVDRPISAVGTEVQEDRPTRHASRGPYGFHLCGRSMLLYKNSLLDDTGFTVTALRSPFQVALQWRLQLLRSRSREAAQGSRVPTYASWR